MSHHSSVTPSHYCYIRSVNQYKYQYLTSKYKYQYQYPVQQDWVVDQRNSVFAVFSCNRLERIHAATSSMHADMRRSSHPEMQAVGNTAELIWMF